MKCSICGKELDRGFKDDKGNVYCSETCFQETFPKCHVCRKPMKSWITRESDGYTYCEDCYEELIPNCCICGTKMRNGGFSDKEGNKYCSEKCFEKSLPKCHRCHQPMNQWFSDENGIQYCVKCHEELLPVCSICGSKIRDGGLVDEDGNHYCNDACFECGLPKCHICNVPMTNWIESEEDGYNYCSKCYESILPECSICGCKISEGGFTNSQGKIYCSDSCYEKDLPKCSICNVPMKNWYVYEGDLRLYCQKCSDLKTSSHFDQRPQVNMNDPLTAEELSYLTGLTEEECQSFMDVSGYNGDEALEAIDIFASASNEGIGIPASIIANLKMANIYSKMSSRLAAYNTMRGGTKGYGGFVFEELHAADAAARGMNISVLGDNSIADFIVRDLSGKEMLIQAKAGYKPGQIDWSKYQGQSIVIDKGNTALIQDARRAGLHVHESAVFKKQADIVARVQQLESRVLGIKTAPITATATSAHYAGLASAKFAAKVGVSFKLGENIYDMVSGEKDFAEATADIIVDGVKIVGGAYLGTAAVTVAGSVIGAAAGTAAGVAITGAVTTATAAVASTAIGGAVVTGVGTVATGVASAVTAVAAAPLLPLVVGTAAIGFVGKWAKKKFFKK